MKESPLPEPASLPSALKDWPARRRSSNSGVALVIVLVMLTLMVVLIIAFLASTSSELRSARSYAVGLDVHSLADSAVNIVISQVQDATAIPTDAWASQPGMIRTYDNTGAPVTAYKLYSADQLRVTGAFDANSGPGSDPTSQSTDVPSNWSTLPDQYTDLNKPVVVSGISHYPIIDPDAVATGQASTTAMDGTTLPIQGCYLDSANSATLTSTTQTNPVPMPVKWLYILQDGSIQTISSAGIIGNATTSNPIVGRIAFWTDDETCKVNVNTSGEGTFWDRPMAESASTTSGYERGFLSFSLPAQNEFQRYPGHPAMTSLSVIFPPLNGESTHDYNERIYGIVPRLATGGSQSGTVTVLPTTATPTPNANHLFASVDEFLFSTSVPPTNPRTPNFKAPATDFTESDIEKTRFFLTTSSRAPEVNMFNKPRITLWPLQASTVNKGTVTVAPNCWTAKDKLIAFCSTIGAATTNPLLYYFQRYNSYDVTTVRTAGQTYPASISQSPIPSSQSPSMDWSLVPRNQTLYAYLQSLTTNPIPGLGGSLTTQPNGTVGKYSPSVCNQILTEMFGFIRSEVTTATTGTTPSYFYAPGQLSGNLVAGERQVVPLAFTPPGATSNYTTRGFGRFETIQQAALVFYRQDKATVSGNAGTGFTVVQSPPAGGITGYTPAKIGVVLLLDPINVSPGSRPWGPNVRYVVSGLSGCKINGVGLTNPFPDPGTVLMNPVTCTWNETALFGPEFFFQYFSTGTYRGLGPTIVGSSTEDQTYPLFGSATLNVAPGQVAASAGPPAVLANNGVFQFTPPSSITILVYQGYATSLQPQDLVQTINMTFIPPAGSLTAETVRLPIPTVNYSTSYNAATGVYSESDDNTYTDFNARIGGNNGYPALGPLQLTSGTSTWGHVHSPFIRGSNGTTEATSHGDVVRDIEARSNNTPQKNGAPPCPAKGDFRIYAALANVPSDYFEAHGLCDTPADGLSYTDTATSSKIIHSMHMFQLPGSTTEDTSYGFYSGGGGPDGTLIWDQGSTSVSHYFKSNNPSGGNKQTLYPMVPRGITPTQVQLLGLDDRLHPGDWDTGPGDQPDGPYINKPDENNAESLTAATMYTFGNSEYTRLYPDEQGTTYSPNRQIFSPVAFGSLPTGIDPANPDMAATLVAGGSESEGGIRPWQTLLFCPNPEAGLEHPGMGTPVTVSSSYTANNAPQPPPYSIPPDSAFLDFFTMPIVEPYAISEPLSTAGKINMNYQIVPFTYLTRDTAVRAVLKADRMMAIPASDKGLSATSATYKVEAAAAGSAPTPDYRYTINPDEVTGTLAGFQQRFATGDIFRSASEICGIYLVPQNKVTATAGGGETISTAAAGMPTYNTMNSWWSNYTLTGDNVREFPYGYIYARLTTKSNTYTVHVMCQTLKKIPSTPATQFVDGQDQVTSEYRGSYIVQRYLDPNSDTLVKADGKTPGNEDDPNSMVGPYKFRVAGTKRFAP